MTAGASRNNLYLTAAIPAMLILGLAVLLSLRSSPSGLTLAPGGWETIAVGVALTIGAYVGLRRRYG